MTHREFVRLVRRAYSQLPGDLHRRLENVDIVVEEWPGPNEAELLEGARYAVRPLPGLAPHRARRHRPGAARPHRHLPSAYPARLRDPGGGGPREIRITLWHEIGHYLGMTEEDLHRLGYG